MSMIQAECSEKCRRPLHASIPWNLPSRHPLDESVNVPRRRPGRIHLIFGLFHSGCSTRVVPLRSIATAAVGSAAMGVESQVRRSLLPSSHFRSLQTEMSLRAMQLLRRPPVVGR